MKLRMLFAGLAVVLLIGAARAEDKPDYAPLSRMIHKAVVDQVPTYHEDVSDWGKVIPIPDRLILPRLRKRIVVGDQEVLPHGLWKKTRLWLVDPSKDLVIEVRDLQTIDKKTKHLVVDATVALYAEREWQHWQKGLQLLGISVEAGVVVTITFDVDVAVTVNAAKFPPEVLLEPKITKSKLALRTFELNRVGRVLEGDRAREIGRELKDVVEIFLRRREPQIQAYANEALAKSMKESNGKINVGELLKATEPKKP